GADLGAVHREDAVAREELSVRGMAWQHDAHRGREELLLAHEDREVERHREDEVHHRPGDDDDDPFPERLRFEGSVSLFGEDGVVRGGFEHLDEAAERDEPDAILRLLAAEAQDFGPEAEREGDDLDAEYLRPREVPELVDENQGRDEN